MQTMTDTQSRASCLVGISSVRMMMCVCVRACVQTVAETHSRASCLVGISSIRMMMCVCVCVCVRACVCADSGRDTQ